MKNLRKIIAVLLTAHIAVTAFPAQASALPACHYEHKTYTGEDLYAPGSIEASYVDYIMGRWKCDTRLPGRPGLCGRWSNLVRNAVASQEKEKYWTGLRFNRKNFLAVCNGAKPGTKLVLGQAKSEDGSLSHAIVLLKVTQNEVWWADCNWNHDNVIHYRHGTVKDFINFYHYKKSKYSYLHFVVKVEKFRHYSKPDIEESDASYDGTARVVWTKTSGAKEYIVYRASSKKGDLKRLGVTTACSYTDTDAAPGRIYYYAVAAVDKDGKKSWSDRVAAKSRLGRPHTRIKYKKKRGTLMWNAVPGAERYSVWRKSDGGKWRKIKTTTKTSYTNKKLVKGKKYWYKVRAESGKGSSTASMYSPWITTMRYAWVP